jgi:hypothetical protein
MFKHLLQSYIDLFTLFLSGHITDTELEKRYFDLFQNRDRMVMWPDPVFQILDGIFFALDEYSHDPTLRSEGDIDEMELRKEVGVALGKLQAISD